MSFIKLVRTFEDLRHFKDVGEWPWVPTGEEKRKSEVNGDSMTARGSTSDVLG